jgi:hypothetical protein
MKNRPDIENPAETDSQYGDFRHDFTHLLHVRDTLPPNQKMYFIISKPECDAGFQYYRKIEKDPRGNGQAASIFIVPDGLVTYVADPSYLAQRRVLRTAMRTRLHVSTAACTVSPGWTTSCTPHPGPTFDIVVSQSPETLGQGVIGIELGIPRAQHRISLCDRMNFCSSRAEGSS